jgi:D-glycero-D-manno-heptose 1,7-bisphosphate phosphatase
MLSYVNESRNSLQRQHYALMDRDGTIIVDKHYLSDPDDVEFISRAVDGLKLLAENNIGLIVVSNQSGIGRGYFSKQEADAVNDKMLQMLQAQGVEIDAIYCCPHEPEDNCDCRKPKAGMAVKAQQDFEFEFKDCVVIGDKASDIGLGKNIGSLSILVRTGKGASEEQKKEINPDFVEDDLFLAAKRFLQFLVV